MVTVQVVPVPLSRACTLPLRDLALQIEWRLAIARLAPEGPEKATALFEGPYLLGMLVRRQRAGEV